MSIFPPPTPRLIVCLTPTLASGESYDTVEGVLVPSLPPDVTPTGHPESLFPRPRGPETLTSLRLPPTHLGSSAYSTGPKTYFPKQ